MAEANFTGDNQEPSKGETLFDPGDLFEYLKAQVELAYQKEQGEDSRQRTELNGSFYQRVPIPGNDTVPRKSSRVVMQPPISIIMLDRKREFAEIHAITLRGEDGHEISDEEGLFAEQFLVRLYQAGKLSDFFLVDELGVHDTSLDNFDIMTGFAVGSSATKEAVEAMVDEIFKPMRRAEDLYNIVSRWNIVATND